MQNGLQALLDVCFQMRRARKKEEQIYFIIFFLTFKWLFDMWTLLSHRNATAVYMDF
jgi:hypothetical protein